MMTKMITTDAKRDGWKDGWDDSSRFGMKPGVIILGFRSHMTTHCENVRHFDMLTNKSENRREATTTREGSFLIFLF